MKLFCFPKDERLCGKKSIEQLFSCGESLFSFPLRAIIRIYDRHNNQAAVKALFVVSKKRFKRAVHRNLLRRRMREAYRLSKNPIMQACNEKGKILDVAFIYVSDDKAEYDQILKGMQFMLTAIANKVNTLTPSKQ